MKLNKLDKLKQIFTLKRVAIFFMSIFLILFLAGGCSFKYMDWQYYKFKNLAEKESGVYIYDKALYDEVEYLRKQNGGIYHFNLVLKDGSELYKGILSNGYKIESNPSPSEGDIIATKYSRIYQFDFIRYQYFDSNKAKHIIAKVKGFYYAEYGLWLSGDEGAGFHWSRKRVVGGYLEKNIFDIGEKNDR